MKYMVAVFLAIASLWSTALIADDRTFAEFQKRCAREDNFREYAHGYCDGYIVSIAEDILSEQTGCFHIVGMLESGIIPLLARKEIIQLDLYEYPKSARLAVRQFIGRQFACKVD